MAKKSHGGARYSTRPGAKPRGYPPDWRAAAERLARQIRRYAPGPADREAIRTTILDALDELDKPVII